MDKPMDELIFFVNKVVISGAVLGSVYALGAIGVTLIFGILRFAHFAHGDMMTMGAFIAFLLAAGAASLGITAPIPLAFLVLPIALVITSGLALLIDRGFYAPLRARGAKPVTLLIASIGVTLMIQGLIRLIFGSGTRNMFLPVEDKILFRFDMSFLGGTRPLVLSQPQILLFFVTLACITGLHFFLTRSRMGKAMRATSDNLDLAQVSGINTQQVVTVTWLIAGALACLAGTMLALDVNLRPDLAFNIVLPIFAAAIVGGLGNAYGAIAGGLLIGCTEALAVFNWTAILRPLSPYLPFGLELAPNLALVPTEYKLTVAFVILVVTLLWRPTGIFRGLST
jgi:branched-chain amino acid transport system permease protein